MLPVQRKPGPLPVQVIATWRPSGCVWALLCASMLAVGLAVINVLR